MTDKDTFCEYVRLYETSMYSLAFSIIGNDCDAADIISESVYRAYRSLDTLKKDASFKPWILRIVHNTAVEIIRKNSKIIPIDELPDIPCDSHEDVMTTGVTVREAVNNLNQPYRTVVVLFYYENLSVSKIAQITGTNTVAVKKQLSRARTMLRETLKEDFNR